MFTLKCNDYYHTSGMRMTFYTCAFLFTNFYVHASDWLNESSLSLTTIWHHLRMKDLFQDLSLERRTLVRYRSVTCFEPVLVRSH